MNSTYIHIVWKCYLLYIYKGCEDETIIVDHNDDGINDEFCVCGFTMRCRL